MSENENRHTQASVDSRGNQDDELGNYSGAV